MHARRSMLCLDKQPALLFLAAAAVHMHPQTARIEDMRREIGMGHNLSGVDELQLLELLDEGSYGKVFRGELSCDCRSRPPAACMSLSRTSSTAVLFRRSTRLLLLLLSRPPQACGVAVRWQ